MIDEKVHNFYVYFSIFLLVVVLALGGVYYKIANEEAKIEVVSKIVVFETTLGNIQIELFLDESPITAGNFKKLVEEGFYDRIKFHRVIDGFMIQGGDPYSKEDTQMARWGTGGSDTVIEDEFIEGLSNVRGTLAMANSGPNSGSSQFFINVADNTNLDWDKMPASSKHPVFGKVVEGMDVVDAISKVKTTGRPYDRPETSVVIEKAYMLDVSE